LLLPAEFYGSRLPDEVVLQGYTEMAQDERQWALERFIAGVDQLKTVLGPAAAQAVDAAKDELGRALAARDRGDRDAAIAAIARAMTGLAGLGDQLGGAEGAMMRALSGELIKGLAGDDREAVERNLELIASQAGTPKKSDPS